MTSAARQPSIPPPSGTIGVLASGGLDSSILIAHLLDRGRRVQPFYIRTGLVWQECELAALRRFLGAMCGSSLSDLVVLDLPLGDVYGDHWSLTGRNTPDADTPDEAVFLPGRNALLLVKAAVWCQLHHVQQLALAPLGTSPFADAGDEFLDDFQAALNHGGIARLTLLRPFGSLNKRQVMDLGRGMPLELTFSCIAPVRGLHCGQCNKCAERQAAFRTAEMADGTPYANANS